MEVALLPTSMQQSRSGKKRLCDAGFKSVQIRYEYLGFAVFAARK
jgi:hypothetical protein